VRPRSIRRSLLIRSGLSIGFILVALSTWIYLTVRHGLYREVDRAITQTAALLSNQVELENNKIIFEWQEGLGTNRALVDDGLFQFWDETTDVTTRSTGLQQFDLPKFSGTGTQPVLKDINLPRNNHHARAIGIRIYPYNAPEDIQNSSHTTLSDPKTRPFILVVARDAKSTHRVLNRIRWILSIGTMLMLGITYLLISRVIRISLQPIDELANRIGNRTEGQLDAALILPRSLPTELHQMAENFDHLLGRLAQARVRERDFVRHAAHELRTPIAGLRAVTDLALSQPRSAAEYATQMATCQRTAIELSALVSRLTALSRVGQARQQVSFARINVTAILRDCLPPFIPLFHQKNLILSLHLPEGPLWASGDDALLRIILNNLLDNAACYATPDSELRITAKVVDAGVEVTTSNIPEIAVNEPDRLFEPLFRSDSSRHDSSSHLGIGLTLSRDAASAMMASLVARTAQAGRLEFVLMLPFD